MDDNDEEISSAERSTRPANFVGIYFEYNEETRRSKCKIAGCSTNIQGKHTANLERHIMRKHPVEAEVITGERMKLQRARDRKRKNIHELDLTSNDSSPVASAEKDATNPKRKKASSVSVEIDYNEIVDACVEITTVNGRSINIIDDSGFKRIIDPVLNGLSKDGPNIVVNREIIKRRITTEAQKIREKIRQDVKGRLICIKIDNATRLDRSLMGISIQYCKKDKLIVRNICTKELDCTHTAENLKGEIIAELDKCGIPKNMIYSVTTDNAANMLKTIKLLSNDVSSTMHTESETNENEEEKNGSMDSSDEDSEEGSETENEEGSEGTSKEKKSSKSVENDLLSVTFDSLPSKFSSEGVFGQRCVAHTLQLAVEDAIKKDNINELLTRARSLVKKLRTPTNSGILAAIGRKKPTLDCPTRWHSMYDMILSLLAFRLMPEQISSANKKSKLSNLSNNDYDKLQLIVDALKAAKVTTKKLQAEQLQVGDFIQAWLMCKHNTKTIDSSLAKALVTAMQEREVKLMESPALLCAIYLDARWQILLSETQREVAISHLVSVWQRLQALKTIQINTPPSACDDDALRSKSTEKIEDPLEMMLLEKENSRQNKHMKNIKSDIKYLLINFGAEERIKYEEDILLYWGKKK